MINNTAKFTLRTESDLLKKFRFVADYNGRSSNRELEVLMKRHIAEFEKEHGKITLEWLQSYDKSPSVKRSTIPKIRIIWYS